MTYFQCSTAMLICGCVLFLNIWIRVVVADGILYPQDSETRQVENLNGLWNFRAADTTNQEQGFTEQWFTKPLDQVIFYFDSLFDLIFHFWGPTDGFGRRDAGAFKFQRRRPKRCSARSHRMGLVRPDVVRAEKLANGVV